MTEIYILNHLGNTQPNDHNSFDTLITKTDNNLGKYRTVKSINNGRIISNLKYYSFNFTLNLNESIEDALIRRGSFTDKSQFTITKTNLLPGKFNRRIYRPFLVENNIMLFENGEHVSDSAKIEEFIKKDYIQLPNFIPVHTKQLLLGINQLATLKEMLVSIFNTVYPIQDTTDPAKNNLSTFGHNIKNLLVLACIEVETQLKGIFKANESNSKDKYTTNDYIKLKDILHLDKYIVRLPFYPDLNEITPFENWSANSPGPTKTLKWYDSYNAVKHNSEEDFHKANLENAIYAVCAVAILVQAQYGKGMPYWKEEIGNFFEIKSEIEWTVDEKILPPMENSDWTPEVLGL